MTEDLNTSELDKEQQSLEMLKSSNATLAEAKSSARSQRKKSKNTINKSKSYTQLDAFVYKKPKISQCEITIDPMEDTIELPSVPIKLIESQQEPGNTPIPTETIENIIDCAKNTNDESPNVITDNEIPSAINIAVNNSVEPILQEKVQIPLNPFFKKLTKRKKSDVSEVSTPSIQDSSKNDECVSVNNLGTQSNNIRKTKRSRKPPNDKLVNLVHSTTIHTDEVSNSIVNVKTKTKAIAVVSPLITTSGSKKSRKLKPIKPIFSESIDIFKEHNSTEVSTSKGENKIDQINDTTEPQSQLLEHQTESIQDIAETTPAINEKIEHIVESTNIAIGSTASQNIVIDIEEANNDDKNITFTESVEPNVQENKIPLNPFFTKLTKRKKSEHIVESNNSTAMTASSIEDSITNDKSTELCNVKSKRTKKAKRSKKLQTDTIKVDEVSSTSTINAKSDTENNDVTMITSPLTATSGPAHSINSKAIDTSVICEGNFRS
ncbi:hypothetical protein BC833DRAFT_421547 [Globomyces pollinis-pini]|nr:hypothetical protein BC833DRAFT_421547 [Globomyces pollinis-pini]